MKHFKTGLCLTLLAAGLAAGPTSGASAAPTPTTARDDDALVQDMKDAATGTLALRRSPATGEVGFVRAKGADPDLLPDVDARGEQGAVDKATAYLDDFAPVFGARPGELTQSDVFADDAGWSVTFTQDYKDIPVFGAELKAHVDKDGDLTSVNGFAAPGLDLATSPTFSESDAESRALAVVKDRPSGYEDGAPELTEGLQVRSNDLMVYRMGVTRGIPGKAKLAWVLEVSNDSTVREMVILDAHTGKPLNRWSMMAHALDRELYEGAHDPADLVWAEGDEFPAALDEDQQNEVLGTSEAYWLFMNTFGYDAWDGAGGKMITVNNDPTIDCPNANWNGVTTNYCTGVTGDDTVAHEWGHAYTESTSGLIYQWQAGAMNEAYSDIWGEVVDFKNARHNEPGEGPEDRRLPGKCSIYQPAAYELGVTITAPAEIAGDCTATPAGFGPEIEGTQSITVVVGIDNDSDGPANDPVANDTTTNGCEAFTNAADVAGSWVFVDRGFCAFQAKVDNAEAAGAIGVVIGNNQPGSVSPAGESDIPGFSVVQADGTRIKSVAGPVTMDVTRLEDPNAIDDSYRWLSGENDPAFGGAIRDMWNPNCFGDPGQVSDAEYHCTDADSGGVHTNSGVVNRTFAIMVDGLPDTVDAIGLDKAANLFWHVQTNYLTPTSGFPELANGLEAACATLTGQPINRVTLGNPTEADGSDGEATPEVIAGGMTAADCAAVTAAIAETELRKDPVQCNFRPMLRKGEVSCGKGLKSVPTYTEDFEDGLEGWDADVEFFELEPGVGGHVNHPWVTTTDMPETTDLPGDAGERAPSTVAFAADPTTGSCQLDENDESSRDGLISPEITVPEGFQPRLSFDHLVATEAGWDGGNVKFSTDGGETFEEIPARAWLFNGPGGQLETLAAGNTNPMEGQTAFTGTDGGEVTGSWGTSVVDLADLDLVAGDTVQFRFDLGRDGCNGVEGWYVDDVTVTVCEESTALPTTTEVVSVKPTPVKKGKPFKVRVKVTADDVPNGRVQIRKGTKVLGRATLDARGVAVITVRARLGVGRHKLVAAYLGNASFEASKDRFTIRVVRR